MPLPSTGWLSPANNQGSLPVAAPLPEIAEFVYGDGSQAPYNPADAGQVWDYLLLTVGSVGIDLESGINQVWGYQLRAQLFEAYGVYLVDYLDPPPAPDPLTCPDPPTLVDEEAPAVFVPLDFDACCNLTLGLWKYDGTEKADGTRKAGAF